MSNNDDSIAGQSERDEDGQTDAFDRLFHDAFPLEPPRIEASWNEFRNHTLPEKTAWLRFSQMLARSDRQVSRAIAQSQRNRFRPAPKTIWL
jgi:hypothetical protein